MDIVGAEQMAAILSFATVVVGIVEAIKRTGYLTDAFAPLVSILTGVILLVGWGAINGDVVAYVLPGIISGLSASGLYSGGKAVVQG